MNGAIAVLKKITAGRDAIWAIDWTELTSSAQDRIDRCNARTPNYLFRVTFATSFLTWGIFTTDATTQSLSHLCWLDYNFHFTRSFYLKLPNTSETPASCSDIKFNLQHLFQCSQKTHSVEARSEFFPWKRDWSFSNAIKKHGRRQRRYTAAPSTILRNRLVGLAINVHVSLVEKRRAKKKHQPQGSALELTKNRWIS